MDPITGLAVSQAVQGVAGAAQGLMRSASSQQGSNFAETLRSFLPAQAKNKVNEEELFASLLHERISTVKGQAAADRYSELLNSYQESMRHADGYVPVEKAAKTALNDLEAEGMLTAEERSNIFDAAFASAQLDDNLSALYDGRGSAGDSTIAEADIETALAAAQLMMANFDTNISTEGLDVPASDSSTPTDATTDQDSAGSGSLIIDSGSSSGADKTTSGNSVSYSPNGLVMDGPEGFVFKPESEHEKKLVVLLPPDLAQKVDQVILKDQNGNEIERGNSSGFANGGREHIRFNRAGQDYGENISVEITLSNGDTIEYLIPDPSERYD